MKNNEPKIVEKEKIVAEKLKTNVIIKINDATHTIEGPVGVSKT